MTRIILNNPGTSVLANWYARSYIAGRDGTVSTTRSTNRINPADGTLLPANTPATTQISLGGLPVNMYGSFAQRTNIITNSGATGATSASMPTNWTFAQFTGGITTTVIGAGTEYNLPYVDINFTGTANNTNSTLIACGSVTTVSGSTYQVRGMTKWLSGSWANKFIQPLGGNGIAGGNTQQVLNTVKFLSTSYVANSNNLNAVYFSVIFNNGETCNCNIRFYFMQCEAGPGAGPYIPTTGSATTHNAEVINWNLPQQINPGDTGSLIYFTTPYVWDTSTSQGGGRCAFSAGTSHELEYYLITSVANVWLYGYAGAFGTSSASRPLTSGIIETGNIDFNSVNSVFYLNTFLSQNATNITNPTISTIRVGYNVSGNVDRLNGYVGLIYTPGGLTAAERAALNSLKPSSISFVC